MTGNFPIFESSPDMKVQKPSKIQAKYPWRTLLPGQSFIVGKAEGNVHTLKSLAFRNGKALGKRFKVIIGADYYEVGCLLPKPDSQAPQINAGSFSRELDPAIAQRVETPIGNAPIGWPVIKKEGEG